MMLIHSLENAYSICRSVGILTRSKIQQPGFDMLKGLATDDKSD
jgi:hypothetical protein